MKDVKISFSEYALENGRMAQIAVLIYIGASDPRPILDEAVMKFANGRSYHELIDANLDNPWMRVILENINDMPQINFDPKKKHL